jgi:hypothetical protein
VSKLEKGEQDMDARCDRMEARIDSVLSDVKALVSRELASVNAAIRALELQVTGNSTKYDRVWSKLMKLEARINDQPVQPQGFQENDSPFPRSTMGNPRGVY